MAFRRPYFKDKRLAFFAGYRQTLQTITASGAAAATVIATKIKPYGVTLLVTTGSAGPHYFGLQEPIPGVVKHVVWRGNSTADAALVTHTTLCLFDGTTFNKLLFSTAADGRTSVTLVGLTTNRWAILDAGAQGNSTASPTPAGYALSGSVVS